MKQAPKRDYASVDSLVGQVADQFIERLECGEQPNVEEYALSHPEIADVLRHVLSALQYMRASAAEAPAESSDSQSGLSGCLGDYRILREVGRGGMGIVYEAEQISLRRRVALKVLPFAATLNPKHLQRFQNEARAAAFLHHTNIVPVFGVGCERSVHFYAMQFIEGQTLAALIHDLRVQAQMETNELEPTRAAGSLQGSQSDDAHAHPPDMTVNDKAAHSTEHSHKDTAYFRTVANLGKQAALALEYAHQMGIVHRDIKPANLMVDAHSNLWVTDFGLAQVQSDAGLTMTGDLVGTIRYMSPEQALAQRVPVDHRTDIYSLGVTLYELLTLELAFDGKSRQDVLQQIAFVEPRPPSRLNKAIPAELETIVLKAMAKNPSERYATAQELADDLERFLEDKPIRAKRPTLTQRVRKWSRRHKPIVWSAATSAGLLLTLAFAGLAVSNTQIRQEQKLTQDALLKEKQAKDELRMALEREHQLSAFQRLALAERELAVKNIGRAEELLHECPENMRGLEWHLLKGLHNGPLVLRGDGPFWDVAVSPDGRYVASASLSMTEQLILWDGADGRKIGAFSGHLGPVSCVRFSPDGKHLASFGMVEGNIRLWDVETRKQVRTFRGRGWGNNALLAFSPDGSSLAVASWDQGVRVWDLASGKEKLIYRSHGGIVVCVAFSPDGRRLASSGMDNQIRIWDARTGEDLQQWSGPFGLVTNVAFSPDGQQIAAAGLRGLSVREINTGRDILSVQGMNNAAMRLAFGPDGKRLIASCIDRTVRIWDLETGRETLALRGHEDVVWSVAISNDGSRLASASWDGTLRLWYPPHSLPAPEEKGEKRQASQSPRVLRGHTGHAGALAFSPDHRWLASGDLRGIVRIWDLTTDQVFHTLEGHTQMITNLAFSADGKQLTSVSVEGTMMRWDVAHGELERAWPKHLGQIVTASFKAAFSPDGRWLASVPDEKTIKVWDATTGQEKWKTTSKAGALAPLTLAYSTDGRRLAAAGPMIIKVWDAATGAEVQSFGGPMHIATGLAFRPDGRQLATSTWDGLVSLWDLPTGKGAGLLRGHSDKVFCVAYSPDGRRLASGGADNSVLLWDVQTGKKLATLRGHIGLVFGVAYSGDGKLLATASGHRYSGEILLWDTANLERLSQEK